MLASRFLNRKSMKTEDGRCLKKVKARYLKIIIWAYTHKGKTVFIMVFLFFFSIFVGPKLLKI